MNNQTSKDSILIVDDEKSILDVLISGLSDDGSNALLHSMQKKPWI